MRPSEYWQRQCFVGSSSVSRVETDMRYEIGVDCMMFGSDYPHVEGTWPRTFDWVAATLGGIPEAEQRQILGGNAARLYGFDLDLLDPIAQRIGIPVADLAERREVPALGAHAGRPPRHHDEPQLLVARLHQHRSLQSRRDRAQHLSGTLCTEGDEVDDSKLERWGAWAGIAFVVLVLVTGFLPGSPPKPSDSAAKIAKYFVDKSDEIRITTYVGGLATIAVLFWLGALWRFMRKAEGTGPMLATSALAGGVVAAVLTTVGGIILGATIILKLQNGFAKPSDVRLFYVLGNNFVISGGFGIIVLIASVSLLVLRTGMMPRWVAAVGGVDLVLWIVACGGVTSTKDFIFYFGFGAFVVFAIWVLIVSILMLRAPSGNPGTPAVAEASAT